MSVRAMKDGALEFLTKPFRDQDLLDAIHQALESDRVVRENRAKAAELRRRYESLTPREREVMQLVVRGLLNKQIAGELGVKVKRRSGTVSVLDNLLQWQQLPGFVSFFPALQHENPSPTG